MQLRVTLYVYIYKRGKENEIGGTAHCNPLPHARFIYTYKNVLYRMVHQARSAPIF